MDIARLLAAALLTAGLALPSAFAAEPTRLVPLAQPGPWPWVSRIIPFDGRIWFANSVKFVNHNSADLYSYDPEAGHVRFERHLMSQDAGHPVVHGGRLVWPYEDGRLSVGWGQVATTDGTTWRTDFIRPARIFHAHALASLGDRLLAATAAWRAGLQVSSDGGTTWRSIYDHSTADRRVSRITELVALANQAYGALIDRSTQPPRYGLLRVDGETVTPVEGWPRTSPTSSLVRHGNDVYGLVRGQEGSEIWSATGTADAIMIDGPPGPGPRALASDGNQLYALVTDNRDSRVWARDSAGRWTLVAMIDGGEPLSLAVADGRVFVGGKDADGRGVLWGPDERFALPGITPARPLSVSTTTPAGHDADGGGALAVLLRDPATFENSRQLLRDAIHMMATAEPSFRGFARLLDGPFAPGELSLIGGAVLASHADVARWYLLIGMGIAGERAVPPALLSRPWTLPENRAEKYFDPLLAGLWAVTWSGQADRATIDALIGRLADGSDPNWLRGDVIGTLTAVTGRRFGYDGAAWAAWWDAERSGWQGSR